MIASVRPAWVYKILSQKKNKNASECRDPELAKMLRDGDPGGSALNKTFHPSNVPSKGQETLQKRGRKRLKTGRWAENCHPLGTARPLWS